MCAAAVRAGLTLLALVAITSGARGQTPPDPFNYTRTTEYTYDPATNFVETETVEPDAPSACVKRTHSYDPATGNRTSTLASNCAGVPSGARFTSRSDGMSYVAPASQQIAVTNNAGTTSNVSVSYPSGLFPTVAYNAKGHEETRQFDPRFGSTLLVTGPNQLATKSLVDDFGRKVQEIAADGTSQVTLYCVLPGLGLDVSGNSLGCPTPSASEAPADAVMFIHTEPRNLNGAKMGPFTRHYGDRLGRTIRTATESFDGIAQPSGRSGAVVVKDVVHSVLGPKILESQPYFLASGSSTVAASNNVGASLTSYDVFGRVISVWTADATGAGGPQLFGGYAVGYGSYGMQNSALTRVTHAGLKATIVNDKGQTRIEERNPIGELVRITDANGAQLANQHDAFGNLVRTKDALQNVVSAVFDVRGRKVQLNDPDMGVTMHCYDALGQLTAQQNAKMRGGANIGPCPEAPNDGDATALPVPGWTTLAHDKLGRPAHRIEPEFRTTWFYDDKYADNSACAKGRGKLCEVTTTTGLSRKAVYDSLGRQVNTVTSHAGGPSFAATTTFDSVSGRPSSQTFPTGLRVGYGYSPRGYLEQLSLVTAVTVQPLPATPGGPPGPGTSLPANKVLWQADSVNAWGVTEQQSYANGVVARAAYDAATGRVADLLAGPGGTSTVLNHHYVWDSLNNLKHRTDSNGNGSGQAVTESFGYDDKLNRLTSYTVAAPSIPGQSRVVTLQYNALGMLLYKSDVGNFSYGAQGNGSVRPHALVGVSGAVNTSNGYDANGNLTSATGGKYRSIAYTSFNLPESELGLRGPSDSPRYVWAYDDAHARVREIRSISSGAASGTRTTWFLHPDNVGGLSFESEENTPAVPSAGNPSAKSHRHYLTAGGKVVAVVVSGGNLPGLTTGQTAPTPMTEATAVKLEYWHRDHIGSLASTTDHVGSVTARYAYDPFGKRREPDGRYDAQGQLVVDWSPAVNAGTDRGFTGHEHLDDVGLVHMNGRIYDPTLGVFLQADPHIADRTNLQNFNRYSYCLGNPLTCTDPSGFDPQSLQTVIVTGNRPPPPPEEGLRNPNIGVGVYPYPSRNGSSGWAFAPPPSARYQQPSVNKPRFASKQYPKPKAGAAEAGAAGAILLEGLALEGLTAEAVALAPWLAAAGFVAGGLWASGQEGVNFTTGGNAALAAAIMNASESGGAEDKGKGKVGADTYGTPPGGPDGDDGDENRRGVGGKGWRGDKNWRDAVDKVSKGDTHEAFGGKIASREEATALIRDARGRIDRIEGPHPAPNPHNYPHINYTTASGVKGTIRITGL